MNTVKKSFANRLTAHPECRADQLRRRLTSRTLAAYWRGRRKRVSAMIRVRNGEKFLLPPVLSIVELVDEVVIVDDMSKDSTPEIIARLVSC